MEEGSLLTTTLPDLQRGIAPLGPPAPAQPPLLGCGVAPPRRRTWPRAWGGPSWPFLRRPGLVLSAAAPHLDSILKSRDITLPAKVRLVKATVFPVVMYGCESWTVKKAERRRIEGPLDCKEINPGISLFFFIFYFLFLKF